MKTILTPLLILLASTVAHASEPQERKLFDDYVKYSAEPTSADIWNKAVGEQKDKVYMVQKGDTLWDVSKVLFGDPEFWPKIWSINRQKIYNPHQILPQMNLTFSEGTLISPPSMAAAPVPPASAASGAPGSAATPGATPVVNQGKPGYHDVPGNFPALRILPTTEEPTISEFIGASNVAATPYNLEYMMVPRKIKSLGSPIEYERSNFMGSLGDQVYVKVNENLTPGTYTFIESVKSSKEYHIYRYDAEVSYKGKTPDGFYIFDVIRSQGPIGKEAILIRGTTPTISLSDVKASTSTEQYRIFEAPPQSQVEMGGYHNVFFVKGDNLQVGTKYPIYSRREKSILREKLVGQGLVVHSTPSYATILVVESTDGVKVGDSIGTLGSSVSTSVPVEVPSLPADDSEELSFDAAEADAVPVVEPSIAPDTVPNAETSENALDEELSLD